MTSSASLKVQVRVQKFFTNTTDSIKIKGSVWWPTIATNITNRNEKKTISDINQPVLLFVHQWSKMGGAGQMMEGMAYFMAIKHQYTSVTFDMRGVGNSMGSSTWRGHDEINDVLAIADWIKLNLAKPIIIIGSSAGAPIAGSAFGHNDYSFILGGIFIGYPFGFFSSLLFGNHYKAITECSKPKLFICGDSDGFTSVNQLTHYVEKCKGNVNECYIENNVGHFALESPEFDEKMCALIHSFIQDTIAKNVNIKLWHNRMGNNIDDENKQNDE